MEKKKLQTMDFKGKPYVTVNVRIQEFRTEAEYKGFSLDSEIISESEKKITMKATIKDKEGRLLASGTATEYFTANNLKATENCETSAWGRALGNLGIGIDEAIASSQEMESYERATKSAQVKETRPYPPKQPTINEPVLNPEDVPMCCGNKMAYTEGVSQSGKHWKRYKCTTCQKAQFIN